MSNNINFVENISPNNQAVVVLIDSNLVLDNELLLLDQQYHGIISKTINNTLLFSGKKHQLKVVNAIGKDGEVRYFIIVGIGAKELLSDFDIESIGGLIFNVCDQYKIQTVGIKFGHDVSDSLHSYGLSIGFGFLLASYSFKKYKTDLINEKHCVTSFEILSNDLLKSKSDFQEKECIVDGVFFARDISNEPSNIKTPEFYAKKIHQNLSALGVKVKILDQSDLIDFKMNALLAVGQGSNNNSRLVVMEYNGGSDDSQLPIALVGKGVTFDSGGISLKPSARMDEMKFDMCGSAAVVGTIMVLAKRKACVNVIGVVPLVENMPSGKAQRPGDIVTSMSGKTIEVLNTDAEGRLILADAVSYVQEFFNPECIIDIATLTGAIVVALGKTYAGCFTNDESLAKKLVLSGQEVNEKLWRMPLDEEYRCMTKSDIADIANIGNKPGLAGSAVAAHFIEAFIKENVSWAHIDIAGVAYNNSSSTIVPKKGAIGYGVRLLNQFIKNHYEQ